jgi:hypothetical protein
MPGWATTYFNGHVLMDPAVIFSRISAHGRIKSFAQRPTPNMSSITTTGRLNPPLNDFSAHITTPGTLPDTPTGTELLLDIAVENRGAETWRADGKRLVCVSYHWADAEGRVIENDGLRTRLPRDLQPGEHAFVKGLVRMPQQPGAYRMIWTLVQEEVAWFDHAEPQSRSTLDVRVT